MIEENLILVPEKYFIETFLIGEKIKNNFKIFIVSLIIDYCKKRNIHIDEVNFDKNIQKKIINYLNKKIIIYEYPKITNITFNSVRYKGECEFSSGYFYFTPNMINELLITKRKKNNKKLHLLEDKIIEKHFKQ